LATDILPRRCASVLLNLRAGLEQARVDFQHGHHYEVMCEDSLKRQARPQISFASRH